MNTDNIIVGFLKCVVSQDKIKLKTYFTKDAKILWHNSNEEFTVDEYIVANCEYPEKWLGTVERIDKLPDQYVAVSLVWTESKNAYFRVVSYFTFNDDKIKSLDEYWGDCSAAPQWRQDLKIGKPNINLTSI